MKIGYYKEVPESTQEFIHQKILSLKGKSFTIVELHNLIMEMWELGVEDALRWMEQQK